MDKGNKVKDALEHLTPFGKVVMAFIAPVFAVVAGAEVVIAKVTGRTYNEINIIVYYMLMTLSWFVLVDYICGLPFLSPMFVIAWVLALWKDKMKFKDRCDWAFEKSVEFLLWFKKIGWNYVVSSVIICVVVPVLIYWELIHAL